MRSLSSEPASSPGRTDRRAGGYIVISMPTRRDLLEMAARAAALPGAAEFFSAWLRAADEHEHSTAPPEPPLIRDYQPKFFGAEDFAALQAFTEILIPTDGTPGAREAHCAHFIDFVLQSSPEETQKPWRNAMESLRTAGFHTGDEKGRAALVAAMSAPERDHSASHPAFAAYRLIKQLNTFAFYTSRAGMIEALDYRGNSYNTSFPACTHPEHQRV